ncbi:MAG: Holliday junction branch migration protein RuvA [Caulobacterales bacterium]
MIGKLRGTVGALGEDAAIIEVGGVGYVVQAGARTLARLAPNEAAELWIETQVREDSIKLYGFPSEAERAWFAHLQTVQGVGARVALAILDVLAPGPLADAIALEDKTAVSRAHGVGPKVAQRVVTELKAKAPPKGFGWKGAASSVAGAPASKGADAMDGDGAARRDAISALVNLGFGDSDAARAVAGAIRADPKANTSALIRTALKELQG